VNYCECALNFIQHLRGQVLVIKGLAYLLIYFRFLENSENDSKLKDWINFGIYWKIYFRILGLGLDLVIVLGSVALTLLALLTSLPHTNNIHTQTSNNTANHSYM